VFKSLDALDAAARYAGTPIRSGSPRERFTHLFGVIREVETTARKAWQDELIAAGGTNRPLRLALEKAAKNDALYVTKLLSKDGTSDGQKATDPDRSHDKDPSVHSEGFEEQFENVNPIALAFRTSDRDREPAPRTLGPKLPKISDGVQRLLDEGGWDVDKVAHTKLLLIVSWFKSTYGEDANNTIRNLKDDELDLIADRMDSRGLGNSGGLSSAQKESFIATLAVKLDSEQFARIARAFDDDEQIASVLVRTPGAMAQSTFFVEYCKTKFTDARSAEVKRSAALAAAITVANLAPDDLAQFLTKHRGEGAFMTQVFTEACGYTQKPVYSYDFLGARTTRIVHRFDPTLLIRINQTALLIPTTDEASAFEVFKRTVTAIEWMSATSNDSADDKVIKHLLMVATDSVTRDLVGHIKENSPDRSFFISWMRRLLQNNESLRVEEAMATLTKESAGDYQYSGYLVGIIVRASNDITQASKESIDLASDIVSALLNAVPLGAQLIGETLKTAFATIQEASKTSTNLGDLLFAGIESTLRGPAHESHRRQLLDGFAAGIGSAVSTRNVGV
jgi:hypothetical protein